MNLNSRESSFIIFTTDINQEFFKQWSVTLKQEVSYYATKINEVVKLGVRGHLALQKKASS